MGFTNLNRKIDRTRLYSKRKRSYKKFFLSILVFFLILAVAIYFPLRGVVSASKKIKTAAKGVSEGAKSENLDLIRSNLKEMKVASNELNSSLSMLFWAGWIPYLGGFYSDAKHFAKAATYELDAGQTLADSLDPFKQELGFTGQANSGIDRVTQGVKVLNKVIPQLDKVEPQFKKAAEEVKDIDPNKYPVKFGRYPVREYVNTAKNFIGGVSYAVTEARPIIEQAPKALGEPSAKNYLLIFQNDKELRPTGGFMTAYAFLKIDKGRVSSSSSDDIYRLDEKLLNVRKSKICPLTPPDPIVKYLPEANGKPRTAWSMRDSNLSPDVPTSMRDFERLYSYLGEGTKFDGIILIDTYVVESLIAITGPVEVFGTKYSADLDKRCNCPNVIYELERYSQIIEKGEADRKAVLGTLMQQILARSLNASSDNLPLFINAGVNLANKKDIIFYMRDQDLQQSLSKLNWTGEIRQTSADYLNINDSNFAGGKSNLYVEEKVELDITPAQNGKARHKLTIDYSNPQPYNTWLNGINRDYVRIYVPKGSSLINSKGSDVKVTTIEDQLGKTVFEAFIQIRPQNSRTLIFEYDVPISQSGKEWPLLVQKQPGTKDFKYTIKVNGKKKTDFNLAFDKNINIPL